MAETVAWVTVLPTVKLYEVASALNSLMSTGSIARDLSAVSVEGTRVFTTSDQPPIPTAFPADTRTSYVVPTTRTAESRVVIV